MATGGNYVEKVNWTLDVDVFKSSVSVTSATQVLHSTVGQCFM